MNIPFLEEENNLGRFQFWKKKFIYALFLESWDICPVAINLLQLTIR